MNSVLASLGWVSRIITYIAAALAALMMVHVTIDVILSQFIAEPLPGTVDYVSYFRGVMWFLAADIVPGIMIAFP